VACAECDDSLPFSGASSIPLSYILFPATLLHPLFFHPLSLHFAIYEGKSVSKLQIMIEKKGMEIMTYKQHLFFNVISIQI
jgi:hypothetical protein